MKKPKILEDMSLIEGKVKVTLSYLEEGWNGDYNEDDPSDTPLFRMDVFAHRSLKNENAEDDGKEWLWMNDSSYCTCIQAINTPGYKEIATKCLNTIMRNVKVHVENGQSVKRVCEKLSWLPTHYDGII
jgi:hypothetical protein